MEQKYDPEGTKFYAILAVVLLVLAVWHAYDGWIPQDRWLERYPDLPAHALDFGLYEFYAYNRYTAVLLAIGALVCGVISWRSHRKARSQDVLLDDYAAARRRRKQ